MRLPSTPPPRRAVLAACTALLGVTTAAPGLGVPALGAQVYDLSADFSTAQNPNGPWRYGYASSLSALLAGGFTLDRITGLQTYPAPGSGTKQYYQSPSAAGSSILKAGPTGVQGFGTSPYTSSYAPNQVGFAPGQEVAVIRFIAPVGGMYTLATAFNGLDPYGKTTTTNVSIFRNGVQLFTDSVNVAAGRLATAYSAPAFLLIAGDVFDFTVDAGSRPYFYDETGISATFRAAAVPATVPEPTTWALLGTGLLTVAGVARRRRGA